MSISNRPPINSNNYEVLVKSQMENDKNHNTSRNYASIPIVSTIVVQCENDGLFTYVTVVQKGDHKHNNRLYIMCVTKTE